MNREKSYPTDLSDAQREALKPFLPKKRTPEELMREYVLYVSRSGFAW